MRGRVTAAIILAAGAGRRLGGVCKALLEDKEGKRFVERCIATARAGGARHIVVVVGPPFEDELRDVLEGVTIASNAQPERGMLTSVQAGLAVLDPTVEAALVWPVDMPFVDALTVRAIVEATGPIIQPTHEGHGGHPLRVPRSAFAEILELPEESSLRDWLRGRPGIVRFPVADAGVLRDVDSAADLDSALAADGATGRAPDLAADSDEAPLALDLDRS